MPDNTNRENEPFYTQKGFQKIRLPRLKARAKSEGRFKFNTLHYNSRDLGDLLNDISHSSIHTVFRRTDHYRYDTMGSRKVYSDTSFYIGHIRTFKTSLGDKALAFDKEPCLATRLSSFKLLKTIGNIIELNGLYITVESIHKQSNNNEYDIIFWLHSDKNNKTVLESAHNERAFYTRRIGDETNKFKVTLSFNSIQFKLTMLYNLFFSSNRKAYQHSNIRRDGACCFGYHNKLYVDNLNESLNMFLGEFIAWFKNMGILSPYMHLNELRLYKNPSTRLLLLNEDEKVKIEQELTTKQNQSENHIDELIALTLPSNNTHGASDTRYASLEQKYKNLIERGLMTLDDAWRLQTGDNSPIEAVQTESFFESFDDDDDDAEHVESDEDYDEQYGEPVL